MSSSATNQVSKETLFSILATALIAFSGILSETSMNVTFPHLMTVFHTQLNTLQWITTGYLLAVAITLTLGATLAHNWSERKILFVSLAIFTLGNGMAMFAGDFNWLMLGRILQGGATGIAIPLMFNLIVERVPRQQIGLYMGLSGMVISLAPAIGPTYGGFMIGLFDWHMIFSFILPFPILSFLLGYFFLKNSPEKQRIPFEWISFLLLALALSTSLLAIASLEEGQVNWTYLGIFLVSLLAFIRRSLIVQHPFLDIRILKKPSVTLGLLPFFIYQFSNLSANFLIPNFLVLVTGASTASSGFALLPGTLFGAFLAPFLGRLYDKKGAKLVLYGGNTLFFLALVLLSFFTPLLGVGPLIGIYIFFTLGRNTAFNNTMALSVSQVDKKETADATAIFQMVQTFAGALGTAIAAVIVNHAPSTSQGVQIVFFLLLGLVSLNFFLFYFLFKAI